MVYEYSNPSSASLQAHYPLLSAVFSALPDDRLIDRLEARRYMGRHGYSPRAMWRAYLASFILNLSNTNELIRRLEDDPSLRFVCGLSGTLPHRRTFNRFIRTLSDHTDLVDACLAGITDALATLLPNLGREVAIDSSVFRTHSNPNRRRLSDPEANWTVKNSAGANGGKEWRYGYKLHLAADANYGIPLAHFVTTAHRNDSPELPALVAKAEHLFPWLKPAVVSADKGYDGMPNFQFLMGKGIIPLIRVRGNARADSPRAHGPIREGSAEWKELYGKRQAVERVFKSLKESRRLERHCVRGLRQIALHATMSLLAFQATALLAAQAGELGQMRWMVRQVA